MFTKILKRFQYCLKHYPILFPLFILGIAIVGYLLILGPFAIADLIGI